MHLVLPPWTPSPDFLSHLSSKCKAWLHASDSWNLHQLLNHSCKGAWEMVPFFPFPACPRKARLEQRSDKPVSCVQHPYSMGLDRDEHHSQASACPSLPVSWNACLKDSIPGPQLQTWSRSLGRAQVHFCKFLRWSRFHDLFENSWEGKWRLYTSLPLNQQHHLETC